METMLALALLLAAAAAQPTPAWHPIAPGVEQAEIAVDPHPAAGDGILHVVRVDPRSARLVAVMSAEHGGEARTAGDWCAKEHLVAAINLGMFNGDGTHTGFLRAGERVETARWAPDYRSMLLLGTSGEATLADADGSASAADFAGWRTVVQNLRLVRQPGEAVWGASERRWSEAAIAKDAQGRILFLHLRTPLTMRDFGEKLLALPLGVVEAMHVEGGPEASLSIHAKGVSVDLAGSFETGFEENDDNDRQWPIPNVLGVQSP